MMNRKSPMPVRIQNFHADHPFVFSIYMEGRPLFIGCYAGDVA
jgi:hypothetical protein